MVSDTPTCHIIHDVETLSKYVTPLYSTGFFVFDIDTDKMDANPFTTNLFGFSFYTNRGDTAYIPFISSGKNFIREREALSVLKPVLESNDLPKIVNNLKFQYGLLKRYDIELAGMTFDITLESYVLNSLDNCQDISRLADLYLRDNTVLTRSSQYCHIPVPDMEKKVMSASENINVILRLHQELWPRIEKFSDLKNILEQIDTPMASVLSRIERTGVLVDDNLLLFYSRELTRRLNELQIEAYHLVEETFNISSTKQLKRILYEKQKLPVIKKTKKGEPSINEKVLTELALTHPLPNLILEYRSLTKLKYTYTDRLLRMINPQSKRLHTSYHQNITATGRLSSSEPNLQNIPVRKDGLRIRQAFVAPQEFFLVSADYSQIELRIMAHLSGDISLRNAFYANEDIHRATASEIFDTPVNHVTSDQRRRAKVINFGLIYGMSYFGLAQKLSVSKTQAKKYMRCYFNRYSGVFNYMEELRKKGRDQGYVSTLDGRRIYLPNIHSGNDRKKKGAERSAINATIQGTAADIIKRAMISVDRWLQRESPPARMIMQIHDELVFEIHKDILERALFMIPMLMESAIILDVPLIVEIRVGENWGELEHWNKSMT